MYDDDDENEVGGPAAPKQQWANAGSPLAPWHMWGNEQTIASTLSGAPPVIPVSTGQLLKISYGRPESWRFVFYAELLEAAAAQGDFIIVDFDVTIGIGRSASTLGLSNVPSPALALGLTNLTRGFARFRFTAGAAGYPATKLWTSRGIATASDDPAVAQVSAAAIDAASITDVLVAQEIQCRARVVGAGNNTPFRVNIGAYFAPNVHIRPEWFAAASNQAKFRGGETGGT